MRNLLTKFGKDKSDLAFLAVLQGMNYIIPVLLMPYLLIKLQSAAYGYLGFSMAVVQYFMLLTSFGFDLSATKKIAIFQHDKAKLSKIFFATFYAKLLLLAASVVIFCVILLLPIEKIAIYRLALLCSFPMVIGTVFTFNFLFQGIGKIKLLSVFSIISRILLLPSIFFVVKTANDYPFAIGIQSATYIVTAAISCAWLYKNKIVEKVRISFADIGAEFKDSFPLFLSQAATSAYTQLFTVILGFSADEKTVGRYAATERIVRALCFVFLTPINQIYYPKIAFLANSAKKEAVVLFNSIKKYAFAFMFLLSCGIFLGSSPLENYLGINYAGIGILLKLLSPLPVLITMGGIFGQMGLLALGSEQSKRDFQRVYFIAAAVAIVAVTILSYFWVEKGAALAVVVTEMVVVAMMFFYYKKKL